jgi:hypothetical protein
MISNYKTLIVSILFIMTPIYAQSYRNVIVHEMNILSVETQSTIMKNGLSVGKAKENNISIGYSILYRGEAHLGSDYYFEYAPGLFFSEESYSGVQIAVNLRKEINDLFCFAGIGSNINLSPHHEMGDSENPETYTFFYSLGAGVKISSIFGVIISYNSLFKNRFLSGQTTDYNSNSTTYDKNLNYILKLGLEIYL